MMTTIRFFLPKGSKPTPEQIAEIREAAKRPIVYDEDCPKQTPEELKQFRRVNPLPSQKIAANE